MVKRLRFQESRSRHARRPAPWREHWVLEPRDAALIGASLAAILCLQLIAKWLA